MKFDLRVNNILSMQDEKGHKELREKLMPGVCELLCVHNPGEMATGTRFQSSANLGPLT
jgi:hypothetical protein